MLGGHKLRVKDIAFKALNPDIEVGLNFNPFRDGLDVDIENVALVGGGGTSSASYGLKPTASTGTQSVFNIRQLMITNFPASGIWTDVAQATVNLNDAIVFGNNTSNNGYRGGVDCGSQGSIKAVNVIAYDNGNKDFYRISAGSSHLFSKDATATGDGSQTGVVVTLSGDKLDQTTQDTYLKGKGWNGSDVAAWAYATGAVELTITTDFIGSTLVFHSPSVIAPKNITLDTIESSATVAAPVVTQDKVINLDTLPSSITYYAPSVTTQGFQTIGLTPVVNSSTLHEPVVLQDKRVDMGTISSTGIVYVPQVLRGKTVSITGAIIGDPTVYDVSIVSSKYITLDTNVNTSVIHGFSIVKDKRIDLNPVYSDIQWYNAEIIGGYRPLIMPKLYTAEGYGLHVRSAGELLLVIEEMAKRIEILERP